MHIRSLLLLIIAVLAACASAGSSSIKTDTPPYLQLAKDKYEKNIGFSFNRDSSYVLCIAQAPPRPRVVSPPLSFFVYDLKTKTIAYKESLPNGKVGWKDNYRLEISLIPGIISGLTKIDIRSEGYVYDLQLKKKLFKQESDGTQR